MGKIEQTNKTENPGTQQPNKKVWETPLLLKIGLLKEIVQAGGKTAGASADETFRKPRGQG